ncbi:MAG: exodeoxyribonuclease VII small subunit [Puniceicoccales bacterium]|jgi:exodeoxyribonuclease VII small subunit|nr:exodeoxyribonuclease VII small subunit [Puniceicoccales bacterium]
MANETQAPRSFDENLRELEAIVESLEQGGDSLETLLERYERGVKLHAECQKTLQAAELRIEQLRVDGEKATFVKLDVPAEESPA